MKATAQKTEEDSHLVRYPQRVEVSRRLLDRPLIQVGQGFRKHEAPSGEAAPFHDSSLQRPQLTDGEFTGALTAESRKQFLGGATWFGLEPGHHARPRGLERIFARAPVSRRFGSFAMGRADLTVSPRVRQTLQECLEIRIPVRKHVDVLAGSERREVVLNGSNLIEQAQRIQSPEDRPQSIFHRFRDGGRGQ